MNLTVESVTPEDPAPGCSGVFYSQYEKNFLKNIFLPGEFFCFVYLYLQIHKLGGEKMGTADERIKRLYARANELRRRKRQNQTILAGCISFILLCALLLFMIPAISDAQNVLPGSRSGMFTGASLLSISTGGYVLVAVIAFVLGVVITSVLIRHKDKDSNHERSDPDVNKDGGSDN